MRGVEPPRANAHRHLKPARLPIPPHPQQARHYSVFLSRVKGYFQRIWDRQGTSYPPQADTVYDGAAVPIAKEDMGWGHAPSR